MVKLNLTHLFYRNSLVLLASLLLTIVFISWHFNNDFKSYLLFLSIFCFTFSYRFSHEYKSKNSPVNLINRNDDIIEFTRLKSVPFVNKSTQVVLDVPRISTLTVGRNCLSVIIDGNGNGYDFQLVGSSNEIKQHLQSLFTAQELQSIDIKLI